MPEPILIPISAAAERRARSRSQYYLDVAAGVAPPPLPPRPGRRVSAVPAHEIAAVNAAEIAGASDEEIRTLVRQLVEQRKQLRPQGGA